MTFTLPKLTITGAVDALNKPIVTPHAAVIIWSYLNRLDSGGSREIDVHAVADTIICTDSIISISTVKRKSASAGSFEIVLAPTHNWVSRITPGSWCAILMSQQTLPLMADFYYDTAKKDSFKMVGRIESVRGAVQVDPETGARITTFVATGQDWGAVFDTTLYFDQSIAESILKNNPLGQAYALLGKNLFSQLYGEGGVPTATSTVNSLIDLWGLQSIGSIANEEQQLKLAADPASVDLLIGPRPQFQLPKEVAKFMRQTKTVASLPIPGTTSVNFAEIIRRHQGRLRWYDDADAGLTAGQYVSVPKNYDGKGVAGTGMFMGNHSLWQLLNALCNNALYELVNDIRWVGDEPEFALYHRIKPFVTNKTFLEKMALNMGLTEDRKETPEIAAAKNTVANLVNEFSLVRRTEIKKNEIIDLNFGTNASARINFIEVQPDYSLIPSISNVPAKLFGQTSDTNSFERDGFNPMFVTCNFLPIDDVGSFSFQSFVAWKYLIREWHFNTHAMLDGAITLVGKSEYIQVGDNIIVDADILGDARFNAGQDLGLYKFQRQYLLAHVENIMHEFRVNPSTGARQFVTKIQFVRGIITNSNGELISDPLSLSASGAINGFATPSIPLVPSVRIDANANTVKSSTNANPKKLGLT